MPYDMNAAEIIEAVRGTVAACKSEAEMMTFVTGIDFAALDGATVAAITDIVEARREDFIVAAVVADAVKPLAATTPDRIARVARIANAHGADAAFDYVQNHITPAAFYALAEALNVKFDGRAIVAAAVAAHADNA